MNVFENNVKLLEDFYEKNSKSSIVFLKGEMGLGKSYTINQFIKNKNNVLHIKPGFANDYFLLPFIDALPPTQYLEKEKPYLNEAERIKVELIRVLKRNRQILIFENMTIYSIELLTFCRDLIRYILSELSETKTYILIELNSDKIVNDSDKDNLLKEILSISFEAQFLNYKRLDKKILKKIFLEGFHSNIEISNADWEYIADSSFGNIHLMLLVVGYLKQEGYIYYTQNNTWKCIPVPEHTLDNIVSKYIFTRYNKLDEHLKTILQKSSLLGPVIWTKHLKQSFELLQVDWELMQIEKISELIHSAEQQKYIFESQDTYKIIQRMIPDDKQGSWNNILAKYYEKKLNDCKKSNIEKLQLFRKIAECNERAHKFKKAIIYYLKAIHMSNILLDYSQSLFLIECAVEIIDFLEESAEYIYPLFLNQAECYKALGKYEDELKIYDNIFNECRLAKREYYQIVYQKACALYNIDQNEEAIVLLKEIEIKLPYLEDDRFSLNVFREIAAIYYFCRKYDEASDYFTRSLNMCRKGDFERDYYLLLRQSSMFWDLEISRKAQIKSLEYFTKQRDLKEKAKVCHNLGTDALWTGDKEIAKKYLLMAKDEFEKFGCSDIHYTYNCIGVYEAVFENNCKEAISSFSKMMTFAVDTFSKLISIINSASCFCSLGQLETCENYIKKYEELLSELPEIIPPYLLYYYIVKGTFFEVKEDYEKSVYYFSKCLKLKLKNEQLFLLGCHLQKIRKVNKKVLKDSLSMNIDALCSISHRPLYDKFYNTNLCLSTLRFWW